MISLTSTNHGENRKISAKRSRQKRWAGVTPFRNPGGGYRSLYDGIH